MTRNFLLAILICPTLAFSNLTEQINNPYQYVWNNEGEVSGMTRFFLDVNNDGAPELFLSANSLIGNGGGQFHVFKKKKEGYAYLGIVFCFPGGIDILPAKRHGFHDLRTCSRLSAQQCDLTVYAFDGRQYAVRSKKVISSSERPKDFKPQMVKEEKSGKVLSWK